MCCVITGNGIDIISSAGALTSNGTDFSSTTLGSPITNQFVLENNGDEDLVISLFFQTNPAEFATTTPSLTIPAGGSEVFDITFSPASLGAKVGSLIINSNDLIQQFLL